MPSCFVCGRTRNKRTKLQNVTFHKFPTKDSSIRDQWYNFVIENDLSVNKITKYSVICSSHFRPELFFLRNKYRVLQNNAVPSFMISRLKGTKNEFPEIVTPCTLLSQPTVDKNVSDTNNRINFKSILVKRNALSSFVAASDTCLDDTPNGLFLKQGIHLLFDEVKFKKQKIKSLKQIVTRQKKDITSMRESIQMLNQSLLISQDVNTSLTFKHV